MNATFVTVKNSEQHYTTFTKTWRFHGFSRPRLLSSFRI